MSFYKLPINGDLIGFCHGAINVIYRWKGHLALSLEVPFHRTF